MSSSASFPSTIDSPPSTLLPRPRSHRAFARRFRNRVGGRGAEGEQDLFGALGLVALQFPQSSPEGVEAEVSLAFGAVHAVEERGQLNEPEAGVHEVKIKHLLDRKSTRLN